MPRSFPSPGSPPLASPALAIAARAVAEGPHPALVLDPEGRVVAAHPEALRRLAVDGLIGSSLADAAPADVSSDVRTAIAEAHARHTSVSGRAGAAWPPLAGARLHPLRDLDGGVLGIGVALARAPATAPAPLDSLLAASALPTVAYVTRPEVGIGVEWIAPEIEQLTGYTQADFAANPRLWSDVLLHPADRDQVIAGVRTTWEAGRLIYLEYRIVRRDGTIAWISDVAIPRDARGGDGALFQGYLVDVTARKERELMLRHVIDSAPDMIAISGLEGTLRFASPSVATTLGLDADAIVGRNFLEFAIPDDHPLVAAAVTRLRHEPVAETVVRFAHVDGRLLDIQLRFNLAVDSSGQTVVVGVGRDITEARRAEEARRQTEGRYAALTENMPLVLYVDEPDPAIVPRYVAPGIEDLVGYTAREWVEDAGLWAERLHPDDREAVLQLTLEAYARLDDRIEAEYRFVHRDGHVVWVHDRVVLVRNEDGTPAYYQGFWLDVTERKELEERYLRSQRLEAVGRLAGGIAHDFNNVLTTVAGYATLLAQALEGDDVLRGEAEEILAAAGRAGSLTRQLLAFSRGQVLKPQPVALNGALRDLRAFLERAAGGGIVVQLDLDPSDPWTFADPGQLEQVVLNLVVNSRDALPDGGTITVSTRIVEVGPDDIDGLVAGWYASLCVTDNGTGMRKETLDRLFEPFFTTKPSGTGSGLGLATVFGIVTQSGGHVSVDSVWDAGTAVTVLLPLRAADASRPTVTAMPVPARAQPGPGLELLLVEDDPQVRAMTEQMLSRLGHRVRVAADGEEALGTGMLDGVDLVVSDIVMPRVGGWELLERLRVLQPELPVLLVSGYAAGDDVAPEQMPANVAFLEKPFRQATLGAMIDDLAHGVAPPTGR